MVPTAFPARLLKELRSCGALSTLILSGKKNVFGTMQLDEDTGEEPRYGKFTAASSNVEVSGMQQASLLLPGMDLTLASKFFLMLRA